jgi:hypothetical protein
LLAKSNSLTDVYKNKIKSDWCWTEVIRSANLFANKNKQYQIPVINNQYPAFSIGRDLGSAKLK